MNSRAAVDTACREAVFAASPIAYRSADDLVPRWDPRRSAMSSRPSADRNVLGQIEASLLEPEAPAVFAPEEIDGLPEPVQRYFTAAIRPGTPLARAARLEMRGQIKLGRWMPFRAREVLAPHSGFVWRARVAGLVTGHDHYANGNGVLDFHLARLVRVAHAEGPDTSRAAAERAGGEGLWLPCALLPRFGVAWSAHSDVDLRARFDVGGHPIELRWVIDAAGLVTSLVFDRWYKPAAGGAWKIATFGGAVTECATFGGLTIPTEGTFGWHYGTDRWPEGEFFRFRITALNPVS
jgi:hypothetical protein